MWFVQFPGPFFFAKKTEKRKITMAKKQNSPVTAADLAKNGYRQQWGLIMLCNGEQDQAVMYEELRRRYPGRKIKVVTT